MEKEKTLVLLKPDSVRRHLIGKIITRFEDSGLKIVSMKMLWPDENLASNHYLLDENWAKSVHAKTIEAYKKENKPVDFDGHMELGKRIQSWNMNFLREGPVVALVIEGPHAIEIVRKMIGSTEPRQSLPGTIRSDFASVESYAVADS